MELLQKQIRGNGIRIYILMFGLTTVLALFGLFLSHTLNLGISGTSFFIILSIIINIVSYFYSDKIVLRSTRAKPLAEEQVPELFQIVRKLCAREGVLVPKLYILEERTINAFATGRNERNSSIAVTRGLLERLNKEEVEGVISHELAHVKNNDVRLMTVVSVIGGLISLLADMYWYSQIGNTTQDKDESGVLAWIGLFLAVFAPLSAFFIQLAISRKREYLADTAGAIMSSNASGLASALQKISLDQRLPRHISSATAHLYFSSPAHGMTLIDRLFSTHPPIQDRINRLQQMK